MVDSLDNVLDAPIIIDFGLSIQVSKINKNNLKDFFYVYAPEYYVWPLEVHYLNLIANKIKNPSKKMLKELANDYVMNNKGLTKNYSPQFLKEFEKKCYSQLIYYNDLPYEERLEKLLNYWTTFDNYSLSIMYLKFLSYRYNNSISGIYIREYGKTYDNFGQVLSITGLEHLTDLVMITQESIGTSEMGNE